MRILVRHGYFQFYPQKRTDLLRFRRLFSIAPTSMLFAKDDYFTFIGLVNLPIWSQVGLPFGGTPAILNFAGDHPFEVMRANRFVYSMLTGLVVPKATFAPVSVNLTQAKDCIFSPKMLLQPGMIFTVDLVPRGFLTGYSGTIDLDSQSLYIDAVEAII